MSRLGLSKGIERVVKGRAFLVMKDNVKPMWPDTRHTESGRSFQSRSTKYRSQQQSTVAGRHVQPTPNSMAAAEAKVGGLSPETIEQIRGSMARARTADAVGDNVACKEALAEVQSVIGP